MNTEPLPKPRVQPGGQIPPLTQLKLRPQEERDWAFHLGESLCAIEAIQQINDILGIDLKWQSTYSRFHQWQAQQERFDDLQDSLQQLDDIRAQADPAAALQSVRTLAMALLLNEAFQAKKVDAFAALNRQLLAQEKLALEQRKADLREKAIADRAALNAQKLELARRAQQEDQSLAQRKVELVEKKLQLEVRKYDDAQKAAQAPENKPLTEDEKCRKIAAVFGMNYDERMAQIAEHEKWLARKNELQAQNAPQSPSPSESPEPTAPS